LNLESCLCVTPMHINTKNPGLSKQNLKRQKKAELLISKERPNLNLKKLGELESIQEVLESPKLKTPLEVNLQSTNNEQSKDKFFIRTMNGILNNQNIKSFSFNFKNFELKKEGSNINILQKKFHGSPSFTSKKNIQDFRRIKIKVL